MTASDKEIIYGLVARGSDVLAEYTDRTGNFDQVTRQLLSKIPNENNRMSYVYPKEQYVFHYIAEDGIIFLCMADEGFGKIVPFRFLADMKNKFKVSFGDRGKTAHAYAFNSDFQNEIRRLMEQANDPRNKTYRSTDSKIYEINEEIENTKITVMESIEKVLSRGEKLELLVSKAQDLKQSGAVFDGAARRLRNRMFCRNIKITLALIFILIVKYSYLCAMLLLYMYFIGCYFYYFGCDLRYQFFKVQIKSFIRNL